MLNIARIYLVGLWVEAVLWGAYSCVCSQEKSLIDHAQA